VPDLRTRVSPIVTPPFNFEETPETSQLEGWSTWE